MMTINILDCPEKDLERLLQGMTVGSRFRDDHAPVYRVVNIKVVSDVILRAFENL